MTPTREMIIDHLTKVMEERSATHGDAEGNFSSLASVWRWWLVSRGIMSGAKALLPEDAAAMCMLAKVARMLAPGGIGNNDNWIDSAGYAICGAELANNRHESCKDEKA